MQVYTHTHTHTHTREQLCNRYCSNKHTHTCTDKNCDLVLEHIGPGSHGEPEPARRRWWASGVSGPPASANIRFASLFCVCEREREGKREVGMATAATAAAHPGSESGSVHFTCFE